MKLTFIIHNAYHTDKVMQLLKDNGIDYYTRWDHATGKGHGSDTAVLLGLAGHEPDTVDVERVPQYLDEIRQGNRQIGRAHV